MLNQPNNQPATPVMTTERLTLRRFTAADADALYPLFADPTALQYTRYRDVRSRAEFDDTFAQHFITSTTTFAIAAKADQHVMGFIELHTGGILTYAIMRNAWGHGYTAEAGRAIVDYAFTQLGFDQVEGQYADVNPASGRVLAKMGLKDNGALGQYPLPNGDVITVLTYRLTHQEWQAEQQR